MKRAFTPLACILAPLTAHALDLTPERAWRDLEGCKIPIVRFADEGKKVNFQPPVKWNVSGGGTSLNFYPPDCPDAVMHFRVITRRPPEPGLKEDLEKWCRGMLPADAADPTLEGETTNPFTIGLLPCQDYTYSYSALGRRFCTSVSVVDWSEKQRFAVVVTARLTDFKAIHETAMRSMFSWSKQ